MDGHGGDAALCRRAHAVRCAQPAPGGGGAA